MILALSIVMILASLLLIVLVLLHRGKGGGLSSMLGGSFNSSLSGSSVVERNLDRLTDRGRCGVDGLDHRSAAAVQEPVLIRALEGGWTLINSKQGDPSGWW